MSRPAKCTQDENDQAPHEVDDRRDDVKKSTAHDFQGRCMKRAAGIFGASCALRSAVELGAAAQARSCPQAESGFQSLDNQIAYLIKSFEPFRAEALK